jgi:hypothetical protein
MSQPLAFTRPEPTEYASFYAGYVAHVPEGDILTALESQIASFRTQMDAIPESRGGHRYQPGKWSLREVVGHISDGERVFAYRALRFARADSTPLPGFEENEYMLHSPFDRCRLADLVDEWEHLRRANLHLFRNLDPAAWARVGEASDNPVSVRAIAYILVGHARHHLETIRTRYA